MAAMDTNVTKDDLWDLRDTLTAQIREGFRGVHVRQDITNGRVQKGEVALGEHGVRLTNVERECFGRRRSDNDDEQPEERRALTRRELRIVMTTLSAAAAAVVMIWKVFPLLMKALP